MECLPNPRASRSNDALPAIVFDTETTGLPPWTRKVNPKRIDEWNGCRLVQLAWQVIENEEMDGKLPLPPFNAIVKPEGYMIPPESSAIHGIMHEHALVNGSALNDVLNYFEFVLDTYPSAVLVAHNVEFDEAVLRSEAIRSGRDSLAAKIDARRKYCTMKTAVEGTKDARGRTRKWPKLFDLYRELFECEAPGHAHDARYDTQVCADIYKRQVKLI